MAQFLTRSIPPVCKKYNHLFSKLRKNKHINIQLNYSSINSKEELKDETNFGFQKVKVSEKTEKGYIYILKLFFINEILSTI